MSELHSFNNFSYYVSVAQIISGHLRLHQNDCSYSSATEQGYKRAIQPITHTLNCTADVGG